MALATSDLIITESTESIPGRRNLTNWHFGQLCLHPSNAASLQYFHGLARSIAFGNNWFHPLGVEQWVSIANEVLARQHRRYAAHSREEIASICARNGFAYIYRAIRNAFIDELRKLYARPRSIPFPPDSRVFSFSPVDRDVALMRAELKNLLPRAAARLSRDSATPIILQWTADHLECESISDRFRADTVLHLAQELGVTRQHAARRLRQFQDLAPTDSGLQDITDTIRAISEMTESAHDSHVRETWEEDGIGSDLDEMFTLDGFVRINNRGDDDY